MEKDNKGYSLVELIIVIAIMALLTGTAFFSINMIFGAGAKACANDIKEALAENKEWKSIGMLPMIVFTLCSGLRAAPAGSRKGLMKAEILFRINSVIPESMFPIQQAEQKRN